MKWGEGVTGQLPEDSREGEHPTIAGGAGGETVSVRSLVHVIQVVVSPPFLLWNSCKSFCVCVARLHLPTRTEIQTSPFHIQTL